MSSQSNPRKFSEKIANLTRKQNEDDHNFQSVMSEVRAVTGTVRGSGPSPPTLHPGNWSTTRPSNSTPNIPLMPDPYQQYWPDATRGRSPGAHYHPYKVVRSDRVPPLHGPPNYIHPHTLYPPPQWNGEPINRAHSDPSLATPMSPINSSFAPPESSISFNCPPPDGYLPEGSFNAYSPDGRVDLAGSLPDMSYVPTQIPPIPPQPQVNCYHAQVGQRHSTGGCGGMVTRLAPQYLPESQSAPTSPAAQLGDHALNPQWLAQRNYSNSPEQVPPLPNIVLTQADGNYINNIPETDVVNAEPYLYYNMQDLNLDNGLGGGGGGNVYE